MNSDQTQILTTENFNYIKDFILENGDRETYSSMYNNNPHYQFDDLNVYLNPESGGPNNHPQWNINSDRNLSDFNEMVIRNPEFKYFRFKLNQSSGQVDFFYDERSQFLENTLVNPEEVGLDYFKVLLNYIKNKDGSL